MTTVPTALLEPSQFETEVAGAVGGFEEQDMSQTTFKVGSSKIVLDVWLKKDQEDTAVGHLGARLPPGIS